MKALIFRETGEPNGVLKMAEIPTPPLAPGEALVRVLLSPINPSDLHMVRGRYGYQPELPASPGAEGVGIVEAVGPGVQGPIVGTRVVFVHTWNTWREQETIIRNLGGNEVICTADEDLRARLQELTAGKGVERAIDCVAGELGAEIARNLAPAGTMLVYGALSSHRQTDPAKFTMPLFAPPLIYSTATVRGWWLPRWISSKPLAEVRAATSDLLTMLSNGAVTPPAIARYSFNDFQEAVRLADGEAGQQKVLLDFSERAP